MGKHIKQEEKSPSVYRSQRIRLVVEKTIVPLQHSIALTKR